MDIEHNEILRHPKRYIMICFGSLIIYHDCVTHVKLVRGSKSSISLKFHQLINVVV